MEAIIRLTKLKPGDISKETGAIHQLTWPTRSSVEIDQSSDKYPFTTIFLFKFDWFREQSGECEQHFLFRGTVFLAI
jgi:hypothetical protein